MIRRTSVMLTVIAVLLFFSHHATAQEGRIKFGKLKVVPSIALMGIYDDNIFLGNGDNDLDELKDDDFITAVKPGLNLEYSLMDRGNVRLGFNGEFAYYYDYDDNDWRNLEFPFSIDYKAPQGLFFGLNNLYLDAEDPFGSANEYALGQITKRWSDDLKTHLG